MRELARLLTGPQRTEKLQEALACCEAALLERRREVSQLDWAATQNRKGDVLCDMADQLAGTERSETIEAALACFDAALTVYTREVLPPAHHAIAYSVGLYLFDERWWAKAADYLAAALDSLDDLFTLEVTAHGRHAILTSGGDLTARLAHALVRTQGADAALRAAEALERWRARATGEAIMRQEAQLAAAKELAPGLVAAFRDASRRLMTIALAGDAMRSAPTRAFHAAGSGQEPGAALASMDSVGMAPLQAQLAGYEEAREARRAYDAVVAHIREILPDFLRQKESVESAVRELGSHERLVYVATTPVGATALLLGGASAKSAGLPTTEVWRDEQLTNALVKQLLGEFVDKGGQPLSMRGGLLGAQYSRKNSAVKLRQALHATMQALGTSGGVLASLAAYCGTQGVQHVVLVQCGLLSLLPLHAALVSIGMTEEELVPLLDVAQVSYAPSARIWTMCRRRAARPSATRPDALVVSDPQPQSTEVRPLPGARDEAYSIKAIMLESGGEVKLLEGEEARYPTILEKLQKKREDLTLAHFACHGLAELTDPMRSGILLAYGARLMTRTLLDLVPERFPRLRLVGLSACQTGLPGTELPDEVVGQPSGWLQAGAMGVLASLWPVSDSVTVAFMTKFYELHLRDGLDPVQALWLAQRWLRGLPTWREDCHAAGAFHAASGPEVNELLQASKPFLDKASQRNSLQNDSVLQNEDGSDIDRGDKVRERAIEEYLENARHWAAFVCYGA